MPHFNHQAQQYAMNCQKKATLSESKLLMIIVQEATISE